MRGIDPEKTMSIRNAGLIHTAKRWGARLAGSVGIAGGAALFTALPFVVTAATFGLVSMLAVDPIWVPWNGLVASALPVLLVPALLFVGVILYQRKVAIGWRILILLSPFVIGVVGTSPQCAPPVIEDCEALMILAMTPISLLVTSPLLLPSAKGSAWRMTAGILGMAACAIWVLVLIGFTLMTVTEEVDPLGFFAILVAILFSIALAVGASGLWIATGRRNARPAPWRRPHVDPRVVATALGRALTDAEELALWRAAAVGTDPQPPGAPSWDSARRLANAGVFLAVTGAVALVLALLAVALGLLAADACTYPCDPQTILAPVALLGGSAIAFSLSFIAIGGIAMAHGSAYEDAPPLVAVSAA